MMSGIPIPYIPAADDWVAVTLVVCFLLSAYVLSRSRKFLLQLIKEFVLHRERISLFAIATSADMRYLLLLIGQTCMLAGVCLHCYFCRLHPELPAHVPSYLLLLFYGGCMLLYVLLKWLFYLWVGWIFFDKKRRSLWLESYSTLLYYAGFALFPILLFVLYSGRGLVEVLPVGLFLLAILKILTFYKWFKLFCNHLYGCSLLFLYFCTLEIVPCFVWFKGMGELTDYLIINF